MAELASQIQSFFLTLVLGLITGVIFHYYQLFIRQARVGRYILYLMDLFLWLLIIALVFWAMVGINQGEVRFYVLLALLMGILLYFRVLSARFNDYLSGTASRNIRALAFGGRQLKQAGSIIKSAVRKAMPRRTPPPPPPPDPE